MPTAQSPDDGATGVAAAAYIATPAASGSGAVDEAVAIWRTLVALGVRDAVFSPGSRSAPLVYALQDPHRPAHLRPHVRLDERAAAFTALGISRHHSRRPGVVVTTSGTATAHLHAAVLEAHHARVPLIVLTADRPVELRDVGANQTTHQAGMYGDAVRMHADLPAPAAGMASPTELRTAVNTTARAFAAATGLYPGPVHLNLGFRDPLTPAGGSVDRAETAASADVDPRAWIPLTRRIPPPAPIPHPVRLGARTLVVAGDQAGEAAREFAEQHDLPLLAEPSSGVRQGPCAVAGYPGLLREAMRRPDHPLRPTQAIVFGHPTLSRPVLGGLLGGDDVEVIVVDPTDHWSDAARRARMVVPAITAHDSEYQDARAAFLGAWQQAAAATQAGSIGAADPPTWQARAALAVWDATGEQDTLVLGSSSLIRDLEQYAPATMRGTVHANRGLAGIDGTLATATGLALAANGGHTRPQSGRTRVLVGDVTALHDLTGMLIGPDETEPELDIVVVDDGGGRIFSSLEHREADPTLLRRFFTTPHGVDIAAVGRALGTSAVTLAGEHAPAELSGLLAERPGGRRLIVVQQEPSADTTSFLGGEVQ